MSSAALSARARLSPSARRCRAKFLHYFPGGFRDETYVDWERGYKERAHLRWQEQLGPLEKSALLGAGEHATVASRAIAIESRTNLLFSFEKMALRDAVRPPQGARTFATALFQFLHGAGDEQTRFERWCACVGELPRRQTRVLTWPVVTVFGFLAQPDRHVFLKPNVTQRAASAYGVDFQYASRPGWETYESLRSFARLVNRDQADLRPRDLLDAQSFIWVMGSDEYPD